LKRKWNKNWKKTIVILSGGFDPVHIGHVRMFREAAYLGHHIIVGLNSDEWLTRKKGKPFMEFEERKEVLESIKYINQVLPFNDDDDTACDLIQKVYDHYWNNSEFWEFEGADVDASGFMEYYDLVFANGGDRGKDNVPEVPLCKELGIEMIWGIGGGKIQSSSDLIKNSDIEINTYGDDEWATPEN